VRFKSLGALKIPEPKEIVLATLPQDLKITRYALTKAFKISELVRQLHQESFEWYGFTIAAKAAPELVIDIGLPKNAENFNEYTRIGPEMIADFQESLPADRLINGWIHSHGGLDYQKFSGIDAENHLTVLDFVAPLLRKRLAQKEVLIKDLVLLVKDQVADHDLARGNVTLITDVPVAEARIMESIYGGFGYGIVIGDGGWHRQEIYYQQRGILSGQTLVSKKEAELILVDTGNSLSEGDIEVLAKEVQEKIQPITYKLEKLERI
jgi:hypothetical protein